MPFKLRDKSDIKIFILYVLMNIDEPLDFVTLHDMVVQDEVVGQFDFMECFFELAETEAIKKIEVDGKEYFMITELGKEAAKLLETKISRDVREKALRSAKRYLLYCLNGTKSKSTVTPLPDGKFRLDCECSDNEGVFMTTSVTLSNKRKAELMKYNFDDHVELVYHGILSLLSGDVNYLAGGWQDPDDMKE